MTSSRLSRGLVARPPMAGGEPISEAVAAQAAEWLTLFMSGEATADDCSRWQAWEAEHPDHARAWKHIETVSQQFKALDPRAGYQALSPYAGPSAPRRRIAVNLLLWGGVAGLAGLVASRTPAWESQLADHRTRTGEQRAFTLDDGTLITLNTASAVNVRFDGWRRRVQLLHGELHITTGHSRGNGGGVRDERPLVVETAEGQVRALGTRFSVRQLSDHTQVAVLESAVEIMPLAGGMPKTLRAGERTSFTRNAVATAATLTETDAAWVRGQIVASDMPLGAFLAELDRYRPGMLRCAPAVADLRVSGVFPLHDTDRILASLPNVLPVQVRLLTRFWTVVEAAR